MKTTTKILSEGTASASLILPTKQVILNAMEAKEDECDEVKQCKKSIVDDLKPRYVLC